MDPFRIPAGSSWSRTSEEEPQERPPACINASRSAPTTAALALIPAGLAQERFGDDAIQASWVGDTLARALGALGRFAEAFGRFREAMQIAEEAGHVWSLLFPLVGLGTLTLDHGDFAGVVAPLERGLELCRTREVPWFLHDFAWALGAAYHRTGRRAEGVALMEDAARGFAERTVPLVGWLGRVGALVSVTASSTRSAHCR